MLVPEAHGGGTVSGDGLRDLAIIAEERGRRLQPGPFISMNVVAATLHEFGSTEHADVIAGICAGDVAVSWVPGDTVGQWTAESAITAIGDSYGFELSGRATMVQDGLLADWFLVTAGAGGEATGTGGHGQYLLAASTPGLTVTPLVGHDITQRFAAVSFDHVRVPETSRVGEDGEVVVERQLQLACALSTSETVGTMDALFDMTCQYATDRTAFGRPIPALFRRSSIRLADMSLSLECGKAIAVGAVRSVQAGHEHQGRSPAWLRLGSAIPGSILRRVASRCLVGSPTRGSTTCISFSAASLWNSLLFGQPDWHRERICRIQGI